MIADGECPLCGLRGCAAERADAQRVSPAVLRQLRRALGLPPVLAVPEPADRLPLDGQAVFLDVAPTVITVPFPLVGAGSRAGGAEHVPDLREGA